jgi:alanyl-tRNA synthetase
VPDDPKTKFMSGNEIREMFLRFFESKGHRRVRSSSLVPHGDPTLLFTNAGMNQFKDVFLGLEKRDYNRATTAQKCVRAGGKHNDLENVGFTKRHHTFFEMMGNFSFGPVGTIGEQSTYFKEKAIPFAWELITAPEWYGMAKDKLYATVFIGAGSGDEDDFIILRDDDAYELWRAQGVPESRIFRLGMKDNFWQMGDTGPCGPCSEIHYDLGPDASDAGHVDCRFPCDCGRYIEIWNLVFMQYNKYCRYERDGFPSDWTPLQKAEHRHSRECLQLDLLPKPSVDTGLGLERVAAVLQGVISNYDTDLFVPLMKRAAELCGVDLTREEKLEEGKGGAASLRVIADHARSTTFLITDGVLPSNEGRGYVLRKIMRRAIYHARSLGQDKPFLFEMVYAVRDLMQSAYPELAEGAARVSEVVEGEETRFGHTLELGLREWHKARADKAKQRQRQLREQLEQEGVGGASRYLENYYDATPSPTEPMAEPVALQKLKERIQTYLGNTRADVFWEDWSAAHRLAVDGEEAFRLYDTFGLPRDFMEDVARDEGVQVTWAGFDRAMEEQRTRARASWKGGSKEAANPAYAKIAERFKTEKDFYHATSAKDCRIEAILSKDGPVQELKPGEMGEVVLDRTPIYAESGGQMADTGAFYDPAGTGTLAEVTGAYYPVAGLVAHKVIAKETLRVGDRICVQADVERRARIIRNHSGTHLVHAALRNILGTHVKQAGSLNSPERLRFDFSHFAHVDPEELRDIEQQVNDEIRHNTQIETNITTLDEALASGALAFFGDKYPEANVRVVTIPDERAPRGFYSKELCGGTHVQRIGDIGVLKIVSEGSVAAGVRRIEAVTGIGALEHYEQQARLLSQVASQLNVGEEAVLATVEKLSHTVKQLEKELEAQKRKGALGQLDQLAGQVQAVKGVKLVAAEVAPTDKESLRQLVDSLRQKLGSGVVALGMADDGKVSLIAGVTKDLTGKVHAGKMIQTLAKLVGGSGGGRPDLAEAGGKDTSALKSALGTIPGYLEGLL